MRMKSNFFLVLFLFFIFQLQTCFGEFRVVKRNRLVIPSLLSRDQKSNKDHDNAKKLFVSQDIDKIISIRGGKNVDWKYFLVGSLCAALSHGLSTPIDVVKTRIQSFPEIYKDGIIKATIDIINTEGLNYLFSGLGPTVVGYGMEGALKFGIYETVKSILFRNFPYSFYHLLIASLASAVVSSIALSPMEAARVKIVGNKDWSNETIISSIRRLISEEGFSSMLKYFYVMLIKQVPYTIAKQVSFDIISDVFNVIITGNFRPSFYSTWLTSFLSSFFTSFFTCLISQPGDTIVTKAMSEPINQVSLLAILSEIYKKHGIFGFFLGLEARLTHVLFTLTIQLILYKQLKSLMNLD